MLQWLFDLARRLVFLAHETQENKDHVKALEQEVEALSRAVQELRYEVRRNRENEEHEREKLTLRLENVLLRFERRLPPGERSPELQDPPDSDPESP
jgi:chromosome segregation ATPase